ncbi:hypothetical protein MRX96_033483 [Rhipicephalus microplus]
MSVVAEVREKNEEDEARYSAVGFRSRARHLVPEDTWSCRATGTSSIRSVLPARGSGGGTYPSSSRLVYHVNNVEISGYGPEFQQRCSAGTWLRGWCLPFK